MRKTTWALIAAIAVAGALWTTTASAQTNADKLEISAFAVNMSNIATGSNAMVQITVNAWSTAEERERLITTVLEKGPDALLKELQKTPDKGRFRIPTARQPDPHQLSMGLDLHYAWQSPLPDGGRRIVLATDRYIGFQEARSQPRTIDYPITLIELRVDSSGKGQGKLAYATKISFNKKDNQLEIENYSSEPVRLNNVEVKVKK
jgi:hypothetical protein